MVHGAAAHRNLKYLKAVKWPVLSAAASHGISNSVPCVFGCFCVSSASRGLTPHLQVVPTSVKINANEWLNMMEDFIVPSMCDVLGPYYETHVHEPSREEFSCRDGLDANTQDTKTARKKQHQNTQQASAVSFSSPLAALILIRLTRGLWTRSSGRCPHPLKAEASRACAAVRSSQLLQGLLCVIGRITLHHVAPPKVTTHTNNRNDVSRDNFELAQSVTYPVKAYTLPLSTGILDTFTCSNSPKSVNSTLFPQFTTQVQLFFSEKTHTHIRDTDWW